MNDSERLKFVLAATQMNPNSFAKSLGKERAQGIYDVLNGKVGISKKLAKEITNIYPTISETWLLTGLGDMRAGQEDPSIDKEIAETIQELLNKGESIGGGSVPYEFVQQLFREREKHDEIIASLQKTIEEQRKMLEQITRQLDELRKK